MIYLIAVMSYAVLVVVLTRFFRTIHDWDDEIGRMKDLHGREARKAVAQGIVM